MDPKDSTPQAEASADAVNPMTVYLAAADVNDSISEGWRKMTEFQFQFPEPSVTGAQVDDATEAFNFFFRGLQKMSAGTRSELLDMLNEQDFELFMQFVEGLCEQKPVWRQRVHVVVRKWGTISPAFKEVADKRSIGSTPLVEEVAGTGPIGSTASVEASSAAPGLPAAPALPGWTRICYSDASAKETTGEALIWDLPMAEVTALARAGTRVRIQERGKPSQAVQSKPGAYPIEDVRKGVPIGFARELRKSEVARFWEVAPESCDTEAALAERLWHSKKAWGNTNNDKLELRIYQCSDNAKGIHWSPASCGWTHKSLGSTDLELYIDAKPSSDAEAGPEPARSSPKIPVDDPVEFRMRFLNYNMANSSRFANVSDLPGHLGPKKFEDTLKEPFADGKPLDLAFCSLVETRASVKEWAEAWNASAKDVGHQLSSVIALSAARASAESTSSAIRGVVEGLAVGYNGNLKTVLAYSGEKFVAENCQQLHGRLPETTVMGVPIPNPKKAFTGSSIIAFRHPENFKLVFAGAHFPIEKISEMFEHPGNPLHGAKIALAKVLRKILRRAARRGLVDNGSILILQGDLNSRTVLVDTGKEVVATDLLKEVLQDRSLQAAIHHNLPLPSGTWQEVVDCEPTSLPVTYKYHDEIGQLYTQASDDGGAAPAVTIGAVLEAAKAASGKLVEDSDAYKRIMDAVGPEKLAEWGFVYKEGSFRPFRFPASADRVIYWAPLGLAQRLKWELPQGGYKVLHSQDGSDHRPVTLETVLRISPPVEGGANFSFQWAAPKHNSSMEAPVPASSTLHEVCEEDGKDSDPEPAAA